MNNWKEYYLLHSKTKKFKENIQKSKNIVKEFLDKGIKVYCSVSGGKDSVAMMHLIWSINPKIKVMSEKDDMDFPNELEYMQTLRKKYKLDLDIITPDISLWDILENIEIIEDVHSRNTEFSTKYFYDLIKEYKKKNNIEGIFLGLRKEESSGRRINGCVRGYIYFSKRDQEYVCQPLMNWSGKDVMAYLFLNDIPILDVYFKTMFVKYPHEIRKAWILPGTKSNRGAVQWLKYYYPHLYTRLSKIKSEIKSYV